MVKIGYVMIVVWFNYETDRLTTTSMSPVDTMEQCEAFAKSQVDIRISEGIPRHRIQSDCIQVVVPAEPK